MRLPPTSGSTSRPVDRPPHVASRATSHVHVPVVFGCAGGMFCCFFGFLLLSVWFSLHRPYMSTPVPLKGKRRDSWRGTCAQEVSIGGPRPGLPGPFYPLPMAPHGVLRQGEMMSAVAAMMSHSCTPKPGPGPEKGGQQGQNHQHVVLRAQS